MLFSFLERSISDTELELQNVDEFVLNELNKSESKTKITKERLYEVVEALHAYQVVD